MQKVKSSQFNKASRPRVEKGQHRTSINTGDALLIWTSNQFAQDCYSSAQEGEKKTAGL